MKFDAEVKELPERFVACVRHVGAYSGIGEAIERIFQWAGPKGLIRFPETKSLAVFHEDPRAVDPSMLRSDACLTVPEKTVGDGDVSTMIIPGGLFAVAHVEIDASEYGAAWDRLISEWMPKHGVVPDDASDRLCYEVYLNDPQRHPEKKHIVDICEPVLRT